MKKQSAIPKLGIHPHWLTTIGVRKRKRNALIWALTHAVPAIIHKLPWSYNHEADES
jgi:hypothetical protein